MASSRPVLALVILGLAATALAAQPRSPAELRRLLPPVPAGWGAEEPSAHVIESPSGTVVEASRSYWLGPGPRATTASDDVAGRASVDVLVWDRGESGDALVPWILPETDPSVPEQGTVSGIEHGGQPGYALDVPAHHASELGLLVRDRFVVRLRAAGLGAQELRGWLEKVNVDELR